MIVFSYLVSYLEVLHVHEKLRRKRLILLELMKDKSSLRDIVNFIKETIKDCKTGKYVIDRETDTALEIVCEEQAYIIKIDNETSINNIKEADELINKLKDILEDEGYTVDKSDLVDSSDYLIIYI